MSVLGQTLSQGWVRLGGGCGGIDGFSPERLKETVVESSADEVARG
jgi:hypothetical protein